MVQKLKSGSESDQWPVCSSGLSDHFSFALALAYAAMIS